MRNKLITFGLWLALCCQAAFGVEFILKSSTENPLCFLLVSSTDHFTAVTGLGAAPVVTLSKAGGTFNAASGTISEIANGWYKVSGANLATDTGTLGTLLLHATGTGADPADVKFLVINAFDPQIAGGVAGGLLIDGSNAGTTTLGALTVTGATTMTDGLVVSKTSGTNGSGLAVTGLGTGSAATFTAGASGGGSGIVSTGNGAGAGLYAAGGTSGNGIQALGGTTAAGLLATGGATADGISAVGGATSGDGIKAAASTSGIGIEAIGVGTTKAGLSATGGSVSSAGIAANGGGNGNGITTTGGATGNGMSALGGATSGDGIKAAAQTSGIGLEALGVGTTQAGIAATGGATTSAGILATGGATSGDGIKATATASGIGLNAVGVGTTKAGIAATGGTTTSAGILATGGATSGDGIKATATTSGMGMELIGVGTTQAGLSAVGGSTSSAGLVATGGGTGNGAVFTSGGGATGDGVQMTAASTLGNGLKLTKTSTGLPLNGDVSVGYVGGTALATHGSGMLPADVLDIAGTPVDTSGTPAVNVTQWSGTNVAAPNTAGYPLVDVGLLKGTAPATSAAGIQTVNLGYVLGSVSTGVAGYVGIDWSHINAPTTTVALSGTTISSAAGPELAANFAADFASAFATATSGAPTLATSLDTQGYTAARATKLDNLDAAVSAGGTAATIATAVWTDTADFGTASSIGKALYTGNFVPGAAGGLLISGANTGTTTFGALTVTGNTLISNGLTINKSTTNSPALIVTGNGTSPGVSIVGGVNGDGLDIVAGGTGNGHGMFVLGHGTGDGIRGTAGASGADIRGNLTGSVTSVTGNVAGNVSGNVTGTIGNLATAAKTDVTNAVWDVAQSGHVTAGTFGNFVDSAISGVSTGGLSADTIAAAVWRDDTSTGDFGVTDSIGKSLKTANAVPGAAGGMMLDGVNAGPVTFGEGLTLSRTSPNTTALTVTGNGTAPSVAITAGATGNAVNITATGANKDGLNITGGSGTGLPINGSVVVGSLATAAKTDVENSVWNAAQTSHTTGGTFGLYIDAAISGVSTGGLSAASIAQAVWRYAIPADFTVTDSIGKSLYTANAAPGATNGLALHGETVAATVPTSVTDMANAWALMVSANVFTAPALVNAPTGGGSTIDQQGVKDAMTSQGYTTTRASKLDNLDSTTIETDVETALTAQGYTTARAPKIDNLDAAVTTITGGQGGTFVASVDNTAVVPALTFTLGTRADGTTYATPTCLLKVGESGPVWIETAKIAGGKWITSITNAASSSSNNLAVTNSGINQTKAVIWLNPTATGTYTVTADINVGNRVIKAVLNVKVQ